MPSQSYTNLLFFHILVIVLLCGFFCLKRYSKKLEKLNERVLRKTYQDRESDCN